MKRWFGGVLLILIIGMLCLLLPGIAHTQDADHTINAAGVLYTVPDGYFFSGDLLYQDGTAYAFEQGKVGAALAVQHFSASLTWNGQTLPISFDWCPNGDEGISLRSQPEIKDLRCAAESIEGNTDTVLFQLFDTDARLDAARYGLCHLTDNTAELLFPAVLEPYEILSLELSPSLEQCIFSTLSEVYYYDGQQVVDLTNFCNGASPSARWLKDDILLFSASESGNASFCQLYAPDTGAVTDLYANETRYIQQMQPDGLRLLRTCGVNVLEDALRVISLFDGSECRFDFPTEGLHTLTEPAEGLLTAVYENGNIILLRPDGAILHQTVTEKSPTLGVSCSVQGGMLSILLENEEGSWVYQLPLDALH